MSKLAMVMFLFAVGTALAAPQLKSQPEVIADGEIKAKVLANSHGIPAPTPEAKQYILTRGAERKTVKWYSANDLWRLRAFAGEWKDKKGNVMRLARVKSLVPDIPRGEGEKDEVEKALDEAEKAFAGEEADLAAWQKAWGGSKTGRFVTAKDRRYYVEFAFAETVKPADAEKLLKAFERSVSTSTAASAGAVASMRWWEMSIPQYRFLTDLHKSKGEKFVKDTMRLMEAMRKSYEFYVPPTNDVGVCVVRVFKSLDGYREYRASTGSDDQMSCGLWDPNREELLIAAEDREQAQNTMRHEAFHQYLHYATKNGHHALWFNEGHACFFENVRYNPAKNTVKVTDGGNRAMWVSKNPERYAQAMKKILKMDHKAFYSGDANLHYCTAWALTYFLEKGAFVSEEFAPYRKIIPTYLALTAGGADADTATQQAWAAVEGRDLAADFLKFWNGKRKQALSVR